MLIRTFWRSCTHRNNTWSAEPVDAFWVEATREEALAHIFPRLEPEQIEESEQIVRRDGRAAALLGHPNRPYCFLVARDLSSIDPFAPHYPVHPMWNAYSPFETMPAITVAALADLQTIPLPEAGDAGAGRAADDLVI